MIVTDTLARLNKQTGDTVDAYTKTSARFRGKTTAAVAATITDHVGSNDTLDNVKICIVYCASTAIVTRNTDIDPTTSRLHFRIKSGKKRGPVKEDTHTQ